jgi:hypothetical protein
MRLSFALALLFPAFASAQITPEQKKETIKWVLALEDPMGGFYPAPQDPKVDSIPRPSLRATNAGLRALQYLGAEIPHKEKHAAFILKCYDPKTGEFADSPGGKAGVAITSIGVMAAAEVDIPHEKYAKAMDYLKANAKTFEEVRIAAAAVEAWGVKDCPFDVKPWQEIVSKELTTKLPPINNGGARIIGSVMAFTLRLNLQKEGDSKPAAIAGLLNRGQLADGGWNKEGEKASDMETTYRVMRAYHMMKQPPGDVKNLRKFVAAHRNKDGGYAVKPGDNSTISGVSYAAIINKWLDELEAKK